MKRTLLIILAILVITGIFSILSINTIPTLEETVQAQWSQILNQYKRRSDLIPQLVKTVQGSANFEKTTLQNVIEARRIVDKFTPDKVHLKNPEEMKLYATAQENLGSALSRLLVVVERYPELKTTQNFITLQSQIEGTENRIAVARQDYIQAVRNFNMNIRTFPGVIWNALFFHKEKLPNFEVSEDVNKVPDVRFE